MSVSESNGAYEAGYHAAFKDYKVPPLALTEALQRDGVRVSYEQVLRALESTKRSSR